jgi:cytochrome c-type biogenesis protein CcmF
MTACPILAWGGGDWKKLWERAKAPVILGSVLALAFIGLYVFAMLPFYTADASSPTWWHHFIALAGVVTAGYAIALPLWLFYDGSRKRAAAVGSSFGAALGWILTKTRTQSGGYLTHLGMGIILLGLVGSTMFVRTHQAVIPQQPGASYEAEGYTFSYVSLDTSKENVPEGGSEGDTVYTLMLDVSKNGRRVGTASPKMAFPQQLAQEGQSTQHVDIMFEPLKDVFLSFSGLDQSQNANLTIKFFPLQWWVWTGFFVTILGSALASWPKKKKVAA